MLVDDPMQIGAVRGPKGGRKGKKGDDKNGRVGKELLSPGSKKGQAAQAAAPQTPLDVGGGGKKQQKKRTTRTTARRAGTTATLFDAWQEHEHELEKGADFLIDLEPAGGLSVELQKTAWSRCVLTDLLSLLET